MSEVMLVRPDTPLRWDLANSTRERPQNRQKTRKMRKKCCRWAYGCKLSKLVLLEVYLLEHKFTQSTKTLKLWVVHKNYVLYVALREVGGIQNVKQGILERFWSILERFWSILELFWSILERFWSILERFWSFFGAFWSVFVILFIILSIINNVVRALAPLIWFLHWPIQGGKNIERRASRVAR